MQRKRLLALFFLLALGALTVFLSIPADGIRSKARYLADYAQAVLHRQDVLAYTRGEYTNIIFLHHSVGRNLIEQGRIREAFRERGYAFWDQDYNHRGLRNPEGESTGYGYDLPYDNSDPDGLARIFEQRVYPLPLNTLSGLLQHEVILLKSCFPNSHIPDAEALEARKALYLRIRAGMEAHPDKIFILLTSPPLNPADTNAEEAANARALSSWLASDDFLAGSENIFVFDFFDHLAVPDDGSPEANTLRPEYRPAGRDSHPNRLANETIAPRLVDFVIQSIATYRSTHP